MKVPRNQRGASWNVDARLRCLTRRFETVHFRECPTPKTSKSGRAKSNGTWTFLVVCSSLLRPRLVLPVLPVFFFPSRGFSRPPFVLSSFVSSLLRRLFLSSTFSNVLPPSLVLGPSRLPFSCILLDHLLTSLVASFPPRLDSLSVPFSLLVSSSCVLVVRFLSPLMYSSSCVLSPCLVWCSLSVSPLIFVYRFLVCPLCSSVH